MIQLLLESAKTNDDKIAKMFINCESNFIDFTVIYNNQQLDFSINEKDWNNFKSFIDSSMKF